MLQSFLYSAVNRMQLHRILRKNAQRHNARRELGLLFIRKDANCDAKKCDLCDSEFMRSWNQGLRS